MGGICELCHNDYEGYGNNGQPLTAGRVCDNCNSKVLAARIRSAGSFEDTLDQTMKDIRWAIENDDEGELLRVINLIYEAGYQDGQESTGAYIPEEGEK